MDSIWCFNMRRKLIRVTTSDFSLKELLKGQLRFLNQYYDVVGIAHDTGFLYDIEKSEGVPVINIEMKREISIFSDLICLWKMYRIFSRMKPDIVHANTPKGSLLAMISARIANVPHRIYTVTGLRYQGETGFKCYLLKIMERITCRFSNKVIPEGEGVRKTLINDNITHKPLNIIHHGNINGKDTSYYSPITSEKTFGKREKIRKSLGFNKDNFVFVFVGRVVKDKGMNELANCMRKLSIKHPQIRLLIVGVIEDKLNPVLPENINYYKQDKNVVFLGWKNDVRPYYYAADALVFPSYREGFPNVVLEAGAMELPSIVTDTNGCNDIISDGENGKIIPPKDEKALYSMMEYFIESPLQIKKMAKNARKLIQAKFEQEDVWREIKNMYDNLPYS